MSLPVAQTTGEHLDIKKRRSLSATSAIAKSLSRVQPFLSKKKRTSSPKTPPERNLPPELLIQIFTYLVSDADRSSSLYAASLVCRTWSVPALELLYVEIEPLSLRSLEALVSTLGTHPERVELVQSLTIPDMSLSWQSYQFPGSPVRYSWNRCTSDVMGLPIPLADHGLHSPQRISRDDFARIWSWFCVVLNKCPSLMELRLPFDLSDPTMRSLTSDILKRPCMSTITSLCLSSRVSFTGAGSIPTGFSSTMAQLVFFLCKCPALERLSLRSFRLRQHETTRVVPDGARLPPLKQVDLYDCFLSHMEPLLRAVAPNLKVLQIDYTKENLKKRQVIIGKLVPMLNSLEKLTLHLNHKEDTEDGRLPPLRQSVQEIAYLSNLQVLILGIDTGSLGDEFVYAMIHRLPKTLVEITLYRARPSMGSDVPSERLHKEQGALKNIVEQARWISPELTRLSILWIVYRDVIRQWEVFHKILYQSLPSPAFRLEFEIYAQPAILSNVAIERKDQHRWKKIDVHSRMEDLRHAIVAKRH